MPTYLPTFLTLLLILSPLKAALILHPDSEAVSYLWLPLTGCTLYFSSDQINSEVAFRSCSAYEYSEESWQKCFRHCCGSIADQQFLSPSQKAIEFCEQVNKPAESQLNKMWTIIMATVTASIVLLLVCLCNTYQGIRERRALTIVLQAIKGPQVVKEVEWSQEEQYINWDKQKAIVWSSKADIENSFKVKDDHCSICLEEGPSAELYCGHQYHPQCVGKWLGQSSVCPCCRLKDVRGVKVFCSTCKWRYYVGTRTLMAALDENIPNQCNQCLQCDENKCIQEKVSISGQM